METRPPLHPPPGRRPPPLDPPSGRRGTVSTWSRRAPRPPLSPLFHRSPISPLSPAGRGRGLDGEPCPRGGPPGEDGRTEGREAAARAEWASPIAVFGPRHAVSPPGRSLCGRGRAGGRPPLPPRSSGPFSPLHPHPPAWPHDLAFCDTVSHFGSWAPQGEGRNGGGSGSRDGCVCLCG